MMLFMSASTHATDVAIVMHSADAASATDVTIATSTGKDSVLAIDTTAIDVTDNAGAPVQSSRYVPAITTFEIHGEADVSDRYT